MNAQELSEQIDRLMTRPRPQRVLARLGRWLTPHIPPRHSITLTNSHLVGVPGMSAPMIQINEPPRDGMGSRS